MKFATKQDAALHRFVAGLGPVEQQYAEQYAGGLKPNAADWDLSRHTVARIEAVVDGITKYGHYHRHFFLPELHECACGEPAGECPKCGAPVICQFNGSFPARCVDCCLKFSEYGT